MTPIFLFFLSYLPYIVDFFMRGHRYLMVYAVETSLTYCGNLTDEPTYLNGEIVPRNHWVMTVYHLCVSY